ncbi:MAG: TIM barrel protein [Prolixibacteraceae bacterium]
MKRRKFIKNTAAVTAGISLAGPATAAGWKKKNSKRPIHVFTKCLQFLSYNEVGQVLGNLGFDGADLTVRRGGQILPENVETDLPKAFRALQKNGVGSNMITTRITDADDKHTVPILKTMADLGIRYYRMGYLKYDENKSVIQNLDNHKITLEKLEKLNRKYGVTANYQNHAGTNVGGPVWDLYHLLKDRDPEYMGVQYDVRHATVEGGNSWPIGMKLLSEWIGTTDIKDFVWNKNDEGKWHVKNVPLGEGMVDFPKYFELYEKMNVQGPVSIHYEYDLGGAEHGSRNPSMSKEEIASWLERDLRFLKNQFKKHNL